MTMVTNKRTETRLREIISIFSVSSLSCPSIVFIRKLNVGTFFHYWSKSFCIHDSFPVFRTNQTTQYGCCEEKIDIKFTFLSCFATNLPPSFGHERLVFLSVNLCSCFFGFLKEEKAGEDGRGHLKTRKANYSCLGETNNLHTVCHL